MDWKDLAPWIAIAVTLILSILVPLFTQIANNHHQIRLMKENERTEAEREQKRRKREAYENFLSDVGAVIGYAKPEQLNSATASSSKVYIYAPQNWWPQLDELLSLLRKHEWSKAEKILIEIAKLMAKELVDER